MSYTVFKQVSNRRFTHLDLIRYYQSLLMDTPKGKAKVVSIDERYNKVTVITERNNQIHTFKSQQIKLLLRPLSALRGKDLDVVGGLAVGKSAANFSVSRSTTNITLSDDSYNIVINFKPDFAVKSYKIDADIDDDGNPSVNLIPLSTKNIGYITLHLADVGYDLFGALKSSYAKAYRTQSS